ncbi:MAG TPA: hypothetical protein VG942_02735, partial [Hyphomonadaceae bacterium]|nr:hypothetical protein [Hyphomonadaceae bacterium]
RATGRAVPVITSPRRPGDAVALYADPAKVRAALGWVPRHSSIDTIVSSAWAFHQKSWKLPQAAE